MKNNEKIIIPEVTIDQHKSLINSLSGNDFIYLYDGRFRYGVVYNAEYDLYDLVVCSLAGVWYCIDTVQKSDITKACTACVCAIVSAFSDGKLDSELHIVGFKRYNRLK